jgi:hypothetical protein
MVTEESDLLLTIAEVAVALAGFSGFVSVLGQRWSRGDQRLAAIAGGAAVWAQDDVRATPLGAYT